jgi:hypothetical protein
MRRCLGLLSLVFLLSACATDRERYCEAVEERQAELSEQVAAGAPADLIAALPTFESLADDAPDDIQDEWTILVDRVGALRDALDAAGVDPATYDAEDPPADLEPADRDRIEAAARDLGSEQTQQALADLEQQALDVCGTPLVV